jgi:hypothetical protein
MDIDIRGSVLKLAELMVNQPGTIEYSLVQKGSEFLAVFEDLNFSEKFKNLADLKKELFLMAAEDLAMGAIAFKTSSIGLQYANNQIRTFISPFGSTESGNVVVSIVIRQVAAFKNWRKVEEIEFPNDELNAGIYYLAHEISKLDSRQKRSKVV